MHIMVDIETVDTKPTAAVVSIGAVAMQDDGEIVSRFYRTIGLMGAIPYGTTDAGTLAWWGQQSEDARREALYPENPQDFKQSLKDLFDWAMVQGASKNSNWWSNGSDFDLVILRGAYDRLGLESPVNFRGVRCFRTLRNLLPWVKAPDWQKGEVAHNALADAEYQTRHLNLLLKALPHPPV